MKKLLALLFFCSMLVAAAEEKAEEKKVSPCEIASQLFTELPAPFNDPLPSGAITMIVKKIQTRAQEHELDEKTLLKVLIAQVHNKTLYYHRLIEDRKKGYIESAKSFGLAALMALLGYGAYYLAFARPAQLEDKLYLLGARNVEAVPIFGGTKVTGSYLPGSDVKKIKSIAHELAYLSANHASAVITTFIGSIFSGCCTIMGISQLLDVMYAKTYFKNYCALKHDLESYLA
jgi:hypothetical protein